MPTNSFLLMKDDRKYQDFYFTFGQNHWTKEGFPMKNSWVRVRAIGYEEARELFIKKFTRLYMETDMTFSMQYNESEFEDSKQYFPNEEYMYIRQATGIDTI